MMMMTTGEEKVRPHVRYCPAGARVTALLPCCAGERAAGWSCKGCLSWTFCCPCKSYAAMAVSHVFTPRHTFFFVACCVCVLLRAARVCLRAALPLCVCLRACCARLRAAESNSGASGGVLSGLAACTVCACCNTLHASTLTPCAICCAPGKPRRRRTRRVCPYVATCSQHHPPCATARRAATCSWQQPVT